MSAFLIVAALPLSSAFAQPVSTFDLSVSANVVPQGGLGVQVGYELGTTFPGRLLIAVETYGAQTRGNREYRYYWVTGALGFGSGVDSASIPYANFSVVPVTEIEDFRTESLHTRFGQRYVPIEIHRDLALSITSGITVRAVGWVMEGDRNLSGDGHFRAFGRMAVDVLGLRYIGMTDDRHFLGGEIGRIETVIGLSWNPNTQFSARVSLGAIQDTAVGMNINSEQAAGAITSEAFTRAELMFDHVYGHYSLYAQAGVRAFLHADATDTEKNQVPLYIQFGFLGRY